MTTMLLNMPEDRVHLLLWLERALFSPQLPRLVAELKGIHGVSAQHLSLPEALSSHAQNILESGLGTVPTLVLTRLLQQPDLLPELRDWVLESGGSYWDSIESADDLSSATQRIVEHVRTSVGSKSIVAGQHQSLTKGIVLFLAMAASVTILVIWHRSQLDRITQILAQTNQANEQLQRDNDMLQQRLASVAVPKPPPLAGGWGFARGEDLARLDGDGARLTKLSGLALEWNKKQPQNRTELAKRLLEFRQGCSQLLLNPPPLTKPHQVWFAARCGDWASSIEQHLHALEVGADFSKALEEARALSADIATELAERAKAAATSG